MFISLASSFLSFLGSEERIIAVMLQQDSWDEKRGDDWEIPQSFHTLNSLRAQYSWSYDIWQSLSWKEHMVVQWGWITNTYSIILSLNQYLILKA
jgi:hypothetical protein